MDELAASTLATLKKSSASADSKVNAVNALKSSIKHQRVPETAQATTLECLRLAVTTQVSSTLVTTGFSGLGHLVKRLTLQEQTPVLFAQRTNLLGILSEKLGDAKETHRAAASQLLGDLWVSRPLDIERIIRETAIQGSNVRAKLAGIQWVKKMHEEQQLQFRSFVPPIVECLEDADGTVRDAAKNVLVELFRNARDAAKADLKRQLLAYNVRKSIAEYILSQLQVPNSQTTNVSATLPASSMRPEPMHLEEAPPEPSLPPSAEVDHIEPLYVHTTRELEDMFRQMQPCFEDKEKEDNWKARDNNVLKMRRLLKGNAPSDHHAVLVASIKSTLDGILKVVNSLRTTMSTNGCHLVQELARSLGAAMEPMSDIILRGIEKMCASTKQIAAQNGNVTVEIIFSYVPYNVRQMQHIFTASGDKNVLPRQFAAGWLQTILRRQAHSRNHFEHTGGLDLAEKCIKKGLADANPRVRELMRATYWMFASTWPDKAKGIMSSLDPKSQQLLEKDPNNPDASKAAFTTSVGPEQAPNPRSFAQSTNTRVSLKEAIAAQRNAARKMPERPASAMSTISPTRQAPPPSASRAAPKPTIAPKPSTHNQQRIPSHAASDVSARSAVSSASSASSKGHGSLMSAPMRRPKRPEVPRSFTADPYAGRNAGRDDTPPRSPASNAHDVTRPTASSHVKSKSTTTATAGSTASSRAASPRIMSPKTSPSKSLPRPSSQFGQRSPIIMRNNGHGFTSPNLREDNFTMVIPNGKMSHREAPFAPSRFRNDESDRPVVGHSSQQLGAIDEDNFTMIMPSKGSSFQESMFAAPPRPATNTGDLIIEDAVDRKDDAVMVYEDPAAEDIVIPMGQEEAPLVLEELPLNEQNVSQPSPPQPESLVVSPATSPPQAPREENQNIGRRRSASPIKKAVTSSPTKLSYSPNPSSNEAWIPDRAETLKTRRLLASGTERVRARTLDPHGFRRLQDLIKNSNSNPDLQMLPLLTALIGYLNTPFYEGGNTKEKALRTQASSCLRAVVSLYASRSEDVKQALPAVLTGLAEAAASSGQGSMMELEKAGDEVINRAASLKDVSLIESCIDSVADFVGQNASLDPATAISINGISKLQMQKNKSASTALALSMLSQLTAQYTTMAKSHERPAGYKTIRTKLASFAVRCLRDLDPDVRRKGMDFAVELYGLFPADVGADDSRVPQFEAGDEDASGGKMEFWKLLSPAGEQSCNLLTYYLARRGRVGAVA